MKIEELLKRHFTQDKKRQYGRYYASELFYIAEGEVTPENFFSPKRFGEEQMWYMFNGQGVEEMVATLFSYLEKPPTRHEKKELKVDDFVISAECDFVFPESILEVKTCNQLPDRIKTSHLAQAECYSRAFDKKVAVMYVVPSRSGWETKVFPYEKNDKLWDFTISKVRALHQKLKEYA